MAIVASLLYVAGAPLRLFALLGAARGRGRRLPVRDAPRTGSTGSTPGSTRRSPTRSATGLQYRHGLYALGSGGWWGLGLGASREKWGRLPEAHTDFIYAVIGEELGLAGTLTVLLLFARPRLRRHPDRPAHHRSLRPAGGLGRDGLDRRAGPRQHRRRAGPAAHRRAAAAAGLLRRRGPAHHPRGDRHAAVVRPHRARRERGAGRPPGGPSATLARGPRVAPARSVTAVHVVLAGGGTAGHVEPALAVADALATPRPGHRHHGPGHRTRSRDDAGPGARLRPCPDRAGPGPTLGEHGPRPGAGPAPRCGARRHRRAPPHRGRRRGRVRRLRRRPGLPRGAPPRHPLGGARGQRATRPRQPARRPADALGGRSRPGRAAARALRRASRCAPRSLTSTARPGGPRPGSGSGSTPTCPRCWCPAGPRARVGSTRPQPARLAALGAAGVQVLHAAGPAHEVRVDQVVGGPPYVVVPYLERMDLAYAAADLMLCRAGAMTCAELAAVGPAGGLRAAAHRQRRAAAQRQAGRRRRRRPGGRRRRLHPGLRRGGRRCARPRPGSARRPWARPRPASVDATPTSGWPTWCSRRSPRGPSSSDDPRSRHPGRPTSAACTSSASAGPACPASRASCSRAASTVSGSDAKDSRELAALRALGAVVSVGHAADQVDGRRHRRGLGRDPPDQRRGGRGCPSAAPSPAPGRGAGRLDGRTTGRSPSPARTARPRPRRC